MTRALHNQKLHLVIPVVLIGAGLKFYYSGANVNDLLWLLTPTTYLVELVTGESFTFESYSGYMSSDYSFLIAAPCSGINFLITAFLMVGLVRIRNLRRPLAIWSLLPTSFVLAYITTIAANTVRVAIALKLHRMGPEMLWIHPDQLHRFEGICVYFGFLMLLFVVCQGLYAEEGPAARHRSTIFLHSLLPLAIYWLVALAVPIANGAYQQGRIFWEHVLFVIVTPLVLTFPLVIFHFVRSRSRARRSYSLTFFSG